MNSKTKVSLRLYGPFGLTWQEKGPIELRSAKLRALIVLLVCAPEGRRTRAWLQHMLWSLSGPEHGRASLRRGLSDLRNIFGEHFDLLFKVSNFEIQIQKEFFQVIGTPDDGEFLEGLVVREERFEQWLRSKRQPSNETELAGPTNPTPAPLKPTIAVIPFMCVRGTDVEWGLGDLFAQELTRTLSRSRVLDVISHLSCRSLDHKSLGLDEMGSSLQAHYIIYGNVRVQDDRFQLSADLTSVEGGRIMWTRELAGSIRDFCRGNTEVIADLARHVGHAVVSDSIELASCQPLPNVRTHALFMSAVALMHKQALSNFSTARAQLEEVISRAPNHSFVHAWLGKWYVLSVQQGWSTDIAKDTALARGCTQRALEINPQCSFSLSVDGFVSNNLLKKFDDSLERFGTALDTDPNNALAWLLKGTLLAFMDQGDEAVSHTEHARSLSPLDPHKYFFDSLAATAQLANRDYAAALELAELSLGANRRHTSTLRVRTIALQSLGRGEEARESAKELCRREPSLTIERYLDKHPAANFRTGTEWALALKEAGVPTH